ncbi:3-isopropylmalate dehydratase small subunit [Stomatohabitans albus]|uniref:3-isopropylmalate dehydratase small subunit n=1 Tax=Stomatohabitans albus TaxID=3110766 RepID=UPI00300C8870
MEKVTVITGHMVPMGRNDVDTDQIMPKQHLKRIERTGFGEFVFSDWRAEEDFVLNDPAYADANVLLSGVNFGSGSSREHAPWGLQQYGFDAVVAESFADIFRSNCAKIGLVCVQVDRATMERLMQIATDDPTTTIEIDLPNQTLTAGDVRVHFDFEEHAKFMLVNGLDDIGLSLEKDADISAFEAKRPAFMPVTQPAHALVANR